MSATGPTIDQKLLQIVAAAKPTTIDEVIDRMNRLDAALPASDGLKWFNWLYLLVTRGVKNNPPAAGWNDSQWVTRLDVVFANLYFAAIESALGGIRPWRSPSCKQMPNSASFQIPRVPSTMILSTSTAF